MKKDTTLVMGTEMTTTEARYALPASITIVGFIWAVFIGFKPAWWIFLVGLLLLLAVSVNVRRGVK